MIRYYGYCIYIYIAAESEHFMNRLFASLNCTFVTIPKHLCEKEYCIFLSI